MFRSTTNFDRALERGTAETLLEPDWDATLQICDSIRSGETPPKYAVNAIKKRLFHQNPHVCIYALHVLESCVKNCGSSFHVEIATRSFMEDLRDMAKLTANETLRNKILELIQVWAHAFRNDPSCKAVQDVMNIMKAEGFKFPFLRESDAMFAADSAPSWAEGDNCHRCRVQFGLIQRQHHCRCCGQVFCDKCSSKTSPIPKFGIEKEVRVCDDCFEKLNRTTPLMPKVEKEDKSKASSAASKTPTAPTGKSEQELREEEELQMAIALSQSEAEAKEQSKRRSSSLSAASPKTTSNSRSNGVSKSEQREDPELSRYLDREYWEQKQWEQQQQRRRSSSPAPSAPSQVIPAATSAAKNVSQAVVHQDIERMTLNSSGVDEKSQELDLFVSNLSKALEMFVNRMNSNKVRGRPIANDSSVQSLFLNITNMHSQLIKHMQEEEDRRIHFEGLQDKLNEIRDSRAALDSLREEHREQKRREAEELEQLRQQQMAQKLDIMRKQKQEYLQYQRQVALQRIQDQEREMQMRKEQQKYGVQPQPSWQPQPSYPPAPGYGQYSAPPPSQSMPPMNAGPPPSYGPYIPPQDPSQVSYRQPPPPVASYPPMMPPVSQGMQHNPPAGPVGHPQAPVGYSMAPSHQPPPPSQGMQPNVNHPDQQQQPPQPEEPLITFD